MLCVDGKLLSLCSVQIENVTFHHEGFFWRCWFNGIAEENDSSIWKFWYSKCNLALFPLVIKIRMSSFLFSIDHLQDRIGFLTVES